jgi:hypothetical protein
MLNLAPLEISWTKGHLKQIEKAKAFYQQARRESRIVTDLEDHPLEYFDPGLLGIKIKEVALQDGEFSLRILNEHGDETITFSANFSEQVKAAEKKFDEYLKKGWTAYAVSGDGKRKRRITSFNANLQEITFLEVGEDGKTFRENLKSFFKGFSQVQMVSQTRPG